MVELAIVGPGVLGSLVAEQYKSINGSATIALVFRSEDAQRRDRLDMLTQCHSRSFYNMLVGWKRRVTE